MSLLQDVIIQLRRPRIETSRLSAITIISACLGSQFIGWAVFSFIIDMGRTYTLNGVWWMSLTFLLCLLIGSLFTKRGSWRFLLLCTLGVGAGISMVPVITSANSAVFDLSPLYRIATLSICIVSLLSIMRTSVKIYPFYVLMILGANSLFACINQFCYAYNLNYLFDELFFAIIRS